MLLLLLAIIPAITVIMIFTNEYHGLMRYTLSGFLPICSNCKKIRDDEGYWNEMELYISKHSNIQFSHGLCAECMKKLHPEEYKRLKEKGKIG